MSGPQLLEAARVAALVDRARREARAEALEDAAKACEAIASGWEERGNASLHAPIKASMARHCAYRVRALAQPEAGR